MTESMNLKDLDLLLEESRDIIKFLARRRNVSNYEHMANEELLSTLKKISQKQLKLGKRKNSQILTTQPPRKVAKLEINQNLTLHRPTKIAKCRKTQNLTTQKNLKLGKCKNTQNLPYKKTIEINKTRKFNTSKTIKNDKTRKKQK